MPTMTYSLSGFTKTNTDMAAGTTFTASATGTPVSNATITSGSLYLSSLKTYSGVAYLDFSLGGASASTATFSSSSTVRGETVALTSYSQSLLTVGSGTITFTLRRTNTGSGNLLNIRAGLSGTLTLNYNLNYTACKAPTSCSISPAVSEGNAIPEGSRNATLSHYAGRVLKRLGDTPDAYNKYLIEAAKCDPPLEEQELETIWRSAQGFFKRISQEDGYIAPDKYGAGDPLRPEFLTDVDEAHVLADVYGGVLRHSMATEFLVYDGKVWTESTAKAHSVMHELTRRQIAEHTQDYAEAKSALADAQAVYDRARSVRKKDGADDGQETPKAQANAALKKAEGAFHAEESYREFLLKCRNSGKIRGILEEAKACLEIDVADLDSDPFLLNTPGGEVNLRTGELLPHDPEHFHTRMTTASPSMEGMKLWLDFLGVITCGDKELEYYLQMTSGEELIGRIFNENMRIKIGEGSNGKSTYTNSKLRIMGTYGGQISAETLTTGAKNGKNWELAEMRGKRLVVASELEEGMRLNTAFVKKICSTDAILGEKKNKDPFSFIPSHTVVLYTNHLPKVGSIDKGTWRRLTVIPFNAVIEGKSDIKNYSEYLIEHSGGAILQWMVDGAKAFIASDYRITAPECVPFLMKLFQDWRKHTLGDDFRAYRDAANKHCPGLTALWNSPFQAEYRAEDESRLLVKFREKDGRMEYSISVLPK